MLLRGLAAQLPPGGRQRRGEGGRSCKKPDAPTVPLPAPCLIHDPKDRVEGEPGASSRKDGARQGLQHDYSMARTMLKVNIDRDDPLELHEQVAAEIRRSLANGEAKPGDRLPPAKDIAAVCGCNLHTVLKAFHQLRDEGLLIFGRGRGVTVAGTPERSRVVRQVRDLVKTARRDGFGREEVIRLLRESW